MRSKRLADPPAHGSAAWTSHPGLSLGALLALEQKCRQMERKNAQARGRLRSVSHQARDYPSGGEVIHEEDGRVPLAALSPATAALTPYVDDRRIVQHAFRAVVRSVQREEGGGDPAGTEWEAELRATLPPGVAAEVIQLTHALRDLLS